MMKSEYRWSSGECANIWFFKIELLGIIKQMEQFDAKILRNIDFEVAHLAIDLIWKVLVLS